MSKNKQDLVEIMSQQADISKTAAEQALDALTEYITNALVSGDKVTIVGWGSWEPSQRAARTGRNPQTGAEMQIPAAVVT